MKYKDLLPRHLINTTSRSNYTAGNVLELICTNGYILDGNNTLTCLENGNWSSPLPQCISKYQLQYL